MAYYSWTFGSTALLGERDWLKRWKMMAPALEPLLAGAHILDLGCNLGLLDTFCALHGAEQVIAVDLEHDILAAAASVAETAGIEEKNRLQTRRLEQRRIRRFTSGWASAHPCLRLVGSSLD